MKHNSLADFINNVTSKELFNITINNITFVTLFGKVTVFPFVQFLKVHKIENFFGFDFEICTFS